MKIRIAAWQSEVLEGTGYVNGQMLTGTEATAVRVAGEIFRAGRDVLLRHSCTGMLVIQCYPREAHRASSAV